VSPMETRSPARKNYIVDAWLVIVLAMCFGAALAGVQSGLAPRIEANRRNDTLAQIPGLVPGAERGERTEEGGRAVYRALDASGALAGWVVPGSGQGFADRIDLLVGLDAGRERITGLYVLEQKETPGLGDNITRPGWRDQFAGKPAVRPLRVVKGRAGAPDEIEALTGATVSSEAVLRAVNEAVAGFRAGSADAPEVQP
jgi:Na+-translocating ferredoxin:NAD+ oxidoreductase subunit G